DHVTVLSAGRMLSRMLVLRGNDRAVRRRHHDAVVLTAGVLQHDRMAGRRSADETNAILRNDERARAARRLVVHAGLDDDGGVRRRSVDGILDRLPRMDGRGRRRPATPAAASTQQRDCQEEIPMFHVTPRLFRRLACPWAYYQFTARRARVNFPWRGGTIRAGDAVLAGLGAANRAPEVFAAPDRLDLRRTPNPHVAFGLGTHFCPCAQLSRIEARGELN